MNTDTREARAAAELKAEYLAACAQPLLTTVSTPTDIKPSRRVPLLDVFCDGLGETKNRGLCAAVISHLMRSSDGKALLEALAVQHGEWYCDAVALTCDMGEEMRRAA